jgi:hypothetical protein
MNVGNTCVPARIYITPRNTHLECISMLKQMLQKSFFMEIAILRVLGYMDDKECMCVSEYHI